MTANPNGEDSNHIAARNRSTSTRIERSRITWWNHCPSTLGGWGHVFPKTKSIQCVWERRWFNFICTRSFRMLCTAVFRSNESLCSEVQQSGGSGPDSAAASPAVSLWYLLVVVLLCAGTQYRESTRAGDRGHHGGTLLLPCVQNHRWKRICGLQNRVLLLFVQAMLGCCHSYLWWERGTTAGRNQEILSWWLGWLLWISQQFYHIISSPAEGTRQNSSPGCLVFDWLQLLWETAAFLLLALLGILCL